MNKNLHSAKRAKNDEFYTQLIDIEKELRFYEEQFKDKVVYCNCDNPTQSNFYLYFKLNFNYLGLKKLISTGYNKDGNGFYGEYDGENETIKQLEGNGDFRSEESIAYLKECDVVVTNPPFSLFREYVAQLMEYGKKFLIIGNQNAITYKEIFPYIKNNELWLGIHSNKTMDFSMPNTYEKWDRIENGVKIGKVPAISWFTNIPHNHRNIPLVLFRNYNENDYPKYDNFNAIEVSRVENIPMDYEGVMGVPITFLTKYCPTQFEIIDGVNRYLILDYFGVNEKVRKEYGHCANINGKAVYNRILIRKKLPSAN